MLAAGKFLEERKKRVGGARRKIKVLIPSGMLLDSGLRMDWWIENMWKTVTRFPSPRHVNRTAAVSALSFYGAKPLKLPLLEKIIAFTGMH